ncbi:UNVERIFIED_CONTAM: hypothetical protein IGO34_24315, partial [Salmonella enterica subsp. enterica serovar Weltevreden]
PTGRAHRALADAEMTAALLLRMQALLRERWQVPTPDHALLCALQRCAKPAVPALLARHAQPLGPSDAPSDAPVHTPPRMLLI